MGKQNSKKAEPEPEPPLLDKPWRELNWSSNKDDDLMYLRNYKPQTEHIRILLNGPVGAGKSSFINSVQSVLRSKMFILALAENYSQYCFTKEYQSYKIEKDKDTRYPIVFNDIMGLSPSKGVLVDDVKLALSGHVKDGYVFNDESRLEKKSPFYNNDPTVNDKIHVLVYVLPADTFHSIPDDIIKKMRDIRKEASRLGIPQVAVLTKVDKLCPEINKDLQNIYKSKYLKQKMEEFSAHVGIPMNCIFPVKNYCDEINFSDNTDVVILSALKHIIIFGDDFINKTLTV